MQNTDKIYEHIKDSTTILIINNNSKLLLESLCDSISRRSTLQIIDFESRKGLMKKLTSIKNKFIKINYDLDLIQFRSSKNPSGLRSDFITVKVCVGDNNSKILFKTDAKLYNKHNYNYWSDLLPQYEAFDAIIYLDKKEAKILRSGGFSRVRFDVENYIFNIDSLIRSTKLRQIKLNSKKESL